MIDKMELFEDYLALIDNQEQQSRMREILTWTKEKFPVLEPKIGWNQPMYTDHGTFIIGFSISKQHIAVSPEIKTMSEFSDDIKKSGYSQSSNIFRIKWSQQVDYSLLERVISYNMKDKEGYLAFWRK